MLGLHGTLFQSILTQTDLHFCMICLAEKGFLDVFILGKTGRTINTALAVLMSIIDSLPIAA